MKRLLALRQRHGELVAKLRGITKKAEDEKRNLNPEEVAQFDATESEARELKTEIEREERLVALETESRQPAPEDRGTPRPTPAEHQPGDPPKNEFRSFGEFLQSVARAGRSPHNVDRRLIAVEERAATGMGELIPADGGFAVMTDFEKEILKRVYELGAVSSRVRRIPISANANGLKMNAVDETSRATGSRWGGVQAYWVTEGGAPTATKPKFRQIDLSLRKLMGLVYATDELLADASALEAVVTQAMTEELNFFVEDAIFNGTGAGQPLGVLNSASLISVSKETGQAAASIVYDNIVKMWARMYARSQQTAVWFHNQDIFPQLATMSLAVGTGGAPAYMPAGGLSGQPYASLMGRPLIPVEYCATLGTLGDLILADFSQYLMIDKGGIKSDSSMHVRFVNDEMTFRFVYRVDGQPAWNAALTPKNGSNTTSPFVALATRA